MNKYFYTHLTEINSITVELDKMDLSEGEKKYLSSLVDTSLHNAVLDAVLSELEESDKRAFLTKLTYEDNLKVWEFLNKKIDNIEDKIKEAIKNLKDELHKDIKEAHVLRKKI